MSRWLVTDIHGCYHTFKALLEQQIRLKRQDVLYLLGDYISKGPFSRQVLDYLMHLTEQGFQLQMLRGNHEQEILNVLEGSSNLTTLREKGGFTFLNNFGINHPADIPEKYLLFMQRLEWYIALDDWLLVHAGFDFDAPDPFTASQAMLNIRNYQTDLSKTSNRRILHGHSPTNLVQIINTLKENKALNTSLDAGCVYRNNPEQAHLLALNLDKWEWLSQKNIDESDNYQP